MNNGYTSLYAIIRIHYEGSHSIAYNIVLKMANLSGITDVVLIISQRHLSIDQTSSSFKCLDMCKFTYATFILITEALHLDT